MRGNEMTERRKTTASQVVVGVAIIVVAGIVVSFISIPSRVSNLEASICVFKGDIDQCKTRTDNVYKEFVETRGELKEINRNVRMLLERSSK
jgi:hypothetical protein